MYLQNKWDILILTDPGRRKFLEQLIPELLRQKQEYLHGAAIGLRIRTYDPSLTLGENRNQQRNDSNATYISYFDDDDWPSPDFISRIAPKLDGVDYVGFRVQVYAAHQGYREYCEMKRWGPPSPNFYSGMSHLNPIRRDLAMQAEFDAGQGEDFRWSSRMWSLGIIKTECVIDEVMYHYLWRAAKDDAHESEHPKRLALIRRISERNACGSFEIS